MKLRMKHLRHPLRTVAAAGNLASNYMEMSRFGNRSQRQYLGDARYDLEAVTNGFLPRISGSSEDASLLERICAAYNAAVRQEERMSEIYRASGWWQQIRTRSLMPVVEALKRRDIGSLSRMYSNFFRDACSDGLIGVPYGIPKSRLDTAMKVVHRKYYLGDALTVLDYWSAQTEGRFPISDLAGPDIGNPFGVLLDGTLVRSGSPYHHYSAHRVIRCLDRSPGTVIEIGGGYGGTAWYLLREGPGVQYWDFDVPESIALASYYLLKAFPQLKFLFYGEKNTYEDLAGVDVILMPLFELGKVPDRSVDVVLSSHAVCDLSREAMNGYMDVIARICSNCFLYIGRGDAAQSMCEDAARQRGFSLPAESHISRWNAHRYPHVSEVEVLYRIARNRNHATSRANLESVCG